MRIEPITGWQDHVAAGRRYLETAVRGRRRPAVFDNELIFQLAAMAVEKLVVGLAHYNRQMPADHTLSGLAAAGSLDAELTARIRKIEKADDLCALSTAPRRPPEDRTIREILAVGREVEHFVDRHLSRRPVTAAVESDNHTMP
jgi:hypothetical protein